MSRGCGWRTPTGRLHGSLPAARAVAAPIGFPTETCSPRARFGGSTAVERPAAGCGAGRADRVVFARRALCVSDNPALRAASAGRRAGHLGRHFAPGTAHPLACDTQTEQAAGRYAVHRRRAGIAYAGGIILRAQTYCCDWADGLDIDELRGPGAKLVRLGASVDDVVSVARDGSFAFTDGLNRYAWLTKRAVSARRAVRRVASRTAKGMLSLDPALSPDGRMVAFIEARGDSQSEIGQAATRRWYTTHTLWLMQVGHGAPVEVPSSRGASTPVGRRTGTASCSFQATRCGCYRADPADRRGFAAPLFAPANWNSFYGEVDWNDQSPGRHRSDTLHAQPLARRPGLDWRGGHRPTTRSSGRRSAASGYRACVLGHAAGVVERSPQEQFDLRVEAAQLVGGPAGERVVDGRVEAQRDLLALAVHV